MKKVILTVAVVLGGLSTFANSAFPMQQAEAVVISVQEEYKEIKTSELPKAVTDALAADFETATLDKAYVNEAGDYKLDITIEEVASSVYADAEGNWIEKE